MQNVCFDSIFLSPFISSVWNSAVVEKFIFSSLFPIKFLFESFESLALFYIFIRFFPPSLSFFPHEYFY